jgi:aspartate/methionine/tyrosine aminotransferase
MVAIYQRRRDRLVAGLNAIPGIRCKTPQGAFYAFPNVSAFSRPVSALANQILEEAGVALLPGTAFGPAGEGYLRISYANSLERIEQGLTRLEAFFRRLK